MMFIKMHDLDLHSRYQAPETKQCSVCGDMRAELDILESMCFPCRYKIYLRGGAENIRLDHDSDQDYNLC